MIERAQARSLTWKLSPDLLGALNSKGYFETANPAWESVLGWTEAEVVSMSIFDLLHPDDLEHTRAGFELTQVGQPALRFANRYRCKDGSYRWISWIGIPEDGYRLLHRPGHHGRARGGSRAGGGPGGASAIPEDGGDRPAHRRHRPRLQQSSDRHHRLAGHRAPAHGDRAGSDDIPRFMDAAIGLRAARRRADASAARLCAPAVAGHPAERHQSPGREHGRPAASHPGRAH